MGAGRPGSGGFRWAWHIGALGVLAFLPSQVMLGEPLWALDAPRTLHVLGFPLAYGAAVLGAAAARGRFGPALAVRLAAGVAVLGAVYLGVLLARAYYARSVLLAGSVGTIVLLLAPGLLGRLRPAGLAALYVAVAAVVVWGAGPGTGGPEAGRSVSRSVLHTALHSAVAVRYRGVVETPRADGGGFAAVEGGYLLATGDGDLYHLRRHPEGDSLAVSPLEASVPLNAEEFIADVGPRVHTPWFRVADVLVRGRRGDTRLFAAHHHWKSEEECFVLRLSAARIRPERLPASGGPADWRTVHETRPCLPLKQAGPGYRFAGLQAGGSLVELGDRLLMTVGDHEFDGWNSERALPRDPDAEYGKTLVLEPSGGGEASAEVFSVGHRNPQGLHVAPDGTVWSTEHGPQGGDELNRVVRGGDYGWPVETYGTEYGDVEWPSPAGAGERTGSASGASGARRPPVFAWVPSVGVSELLAVRGAAFPRWAGDLLVGSLAGGSLFRFRMREAEVAYVERIPVDVRVRDLAEGPEGRILLWTDDASIVVFERAAARERGAVAFRQCTGCHAGTEEEPAAIGPDLDGVVGREIASGPGFTYSEALRALEGRWTRARLDSFLADPEAFAPGTTMQFEGIADEETRAALIDYLERSE